jgi:hypothetical protein
MSRAGTGTESSRSEKKSRSTYHSQKLQKGAIIEARTGGGMVMWDEEEALFKTKSDV